MARNFEAQLTSSIILDLDELVAEVEDMLQEADPALIKKNNYELIDFVYEVFTKHYSHLLPLNSWFNITNISYINEYLISHLSTKALAKVF